MFEDKRKFAIGMIALLVMAGMTPMITGISRAAHNTANYEVIEQGTNDYRKVLDKSKAEVRAWLYKGQNAEDDKYVVFMQLIKKDSSWECEGVDSHIWTRAPWEGDGSFHFCNEYGSFSPFPRDDGNGYDECPIHTAIGSDMGAYVDVGSTALQYKGFDVDIGGKHNSQLNHYWKDDPGETNDWHGAAFGGAWTVDGNLGNAEMRINDLQVSNLWGPFEQTRNYEGVTWVSD